MSHSIVAHVQHAHDVGHDDANGVAALTAEFIRKLEAAGHVIAHHHVHSHIGGHHTGCTHGHHHVHHPSAA